MDVKEEEILGEGLNEHWYYRAKIRALQRYIDNVPAGEILDVGAGSGVFSKALLENKWQSATCVDPAYDADTDCLHDGKPIHYRRKLSESSANLVLMMDVCEHVEDDIGLIKEYAEKVATGTYFLITVPAFQFLFSSHDIFLEHYRRYRRKELVNIVQAAGLEVSHSSYYFGGVFPLAVARRLALNLFSKRSKLEPKSDLRLHAPTTNAILSAICDCELPIIKYNQLFGLSAFCLAKKV